ncbi:CHASE2 domain-containing protein [Marinobacterium stanieri]|uniref:Adenylate cyclase n=1 Tax=Marinobacterium stanieri TaxID=49186 RepID=A0A1N6WCA5_9GAMM|nr:adenylate/guanylate cyclase domain-containing protein [Marinobacterium stanieri]SIQ87767.1 adenylate cyclase [Marinobacterium stanieri]
MRRSAITKWLALFVLQGLLLCIVMLFPHQARELEAALEDRRIQLLQPASLPTDPRIALIDIDDSTLEQEGRWPWSRDRIAVLIERILDQQPALVGIDILFPDHSSSSENLATVLNDHRITTSLVWAPSSVPPRGRLPHQVTCTQGCGALPRIGSWINNFSSLEGLEQAHITPITDPDGKVRRLFPLVCHSDVCIEALALSLMRQLMGSPPEYRLSKSGKLISSDNVIQIPLETDASARIPWYSSSGAVPWISAKAVLNDTVPEGFLQGRVLILGSSAVGLHDRISTPVAADFPAMEAHALLLQGMLDQQVWITAKASWPISALAALLAAILTTGLLLRQQPLLATLFACAVNTLWFGFALWQQQQGLFWPLLPMLAASLSTLALLIPWTALDALHARDILQHQFSHYVAPQVMARIQRQPNQIIGAEPERRLMTVMFADLRNFSAYAANIEPEALAEILQVIMDRLTRTIHQHGGTVDKYIGDAVMAFWGAPLADADHARHAIMAGQALCREMNDISQEYGLPLELSVGINSGEVVVGELGSTHRRSYTLIGAPVNLAAHLEAATRQTPTPILIGEGTQALLPTAHWPQALQLSLSSHSAPVRAWGISPEAQVLT